MRATNKKVIIENISEAAAIFVVTVVIGIWIEIGSSLPKIIGSTISTGIKVIYPEFSLMHLIIVCFIHTTATTSIHPRIFMSRKCVILFLYWL